MALTTVDQGLLGTYAQYTGFKNRIINGDMRIDQRNAGASVNLVNSGNTFIVDRFFGYAAQNSKLTAQRNAASVTPPAGFSNYIGATSSATWTAGASENFLLGQFIEGFNFADLAWGTANAASVAISFWVRSSLTGTFSGSVSNGAADRSYPFTFTVNAANTWEYKTITVAGDTSGTWVGATNGLGLRMYFDLGCGSSSRTTAGSWASGFFLGATGANSLGSSSGATFYITGVQLEAGSTATSFDRRDYGRELMMCQRYYQVVDTFWGVSSTTTIVYATANFQVSMRASPSLSAVGILRITDGYSTDFNQSSANASINSSRVSVNGISFDAANFSGMTIGRAFFARQAATANIALSAEL